MMLISQGLFYFCVALMPVATGIFAYLASFLSLGAYAGAIAPAMILITAIGFQLGRSLWEPQVFAFEDLVVRGTVAIIIMGLVNATCDWFLIPLLGVRGAALATAIAFATGSFSMLSLLRGRLKCGGPGIAGGVLFGVAIIIVALSGTRLVAPEQYWLSALTTLVLLLIGRRFGLFHGLARIGLVTQKNQSAFAMAFHRLSVWIADASNTPRSA